MPDVVAVAAVFASPAADIGRTRSIGWVPAVVPGQSVDALVAGVAGSSR